MSEFQVEKQRFVKKHIASTVLGTDLEESNGEDDLDDEDFTDYYFNNTDDLDIDKPKKTDDPEYFEYSMLLMQETECLLNKDVESLCSEINILDYYMKFLRSIFMKRVIQVAPSLAKMLLHIWQWKLDVIIDRYCMDRKKLLIESNIMSNEKQDHSFSGQPLCPVCASLCPCDSFIGLSCCHTFCRSCWEMYFKFQIEQGVTMGMECMGERCGVLVPEDFLCSILRDQNLGARYSKLCFMDLIKGHPKLRFCPGPNCNAIVFADKPLAKRVECPDCKTVFCFLCGMDYHSPTDCDVIRQWLTKCADDSETAHYISAHTKDCPKCNICIEKNGGCNHMLCSKCKFDFCWMCLGDWKSHGSEYYECSRYKENPNIANESVLVQAREALKKYLFYFERLLLSIGKLQRELCREHMEATICDLWIWQKWENHTKSLQLEEQTLVKITSRINDKVMESEGTWIDWQYLQNAAALLKKCRYTLQYTYPYAYYMVKDGRKQLFEYQQAQLEAEVENLSWKVERAKITHRGVLENQMDIAEKRRQTLLLDFI